MTRGDLLTLELDFERELFHDRQLSLFRRNPSTWELLLYLAQFDEGSEDGVYSTLGRLETRYLGNSALLKFMRERRDDGMFVFTENTKRSKWKIVLSEALREGLESALDRRRVAFQDALKPSGQGWSRPAGLRGGGADLDGRRFIQRPMPEDR